MTTPVQGEYRPEFTLTAEGRDITAAVRQGLVELVLTDNGGATAKADELQLTLLSDTLRLPAKGVRLQLGLGFNGRLTDKGWYVVSGVSSSGPPRKIIIYATAAPMNAQRQAGEVQSQKTRSWDAVTLGDVVTTIASDNGLIPKVAGSLAGIALGHIDQVAESDAALLTRLARQYNAVSKPSGGYWLFLPQGDALTVNGNALPRVSIMPHQLSAWTYSEGDRSASTGKAASGGKKAPGKVSVAYFDEQDGRTKQATLTHDGPDQTHPFTQPGKTQAQHSANARTTQLNRNERRMTLTGPGRPEHLPLTAESRVQTRGFGEREDRDWLIESLVYSLSSQGLSVVFNLVSDIKVNTDKRKVADKKADADKKGVDYFN